MFQKCIEALGFAGSDPPQEVCGVVITLAALCIANKMDMHICGETRLARIWTKVVKIRAKNKAKPHHTRQ